MISPPTGVIAVAAHGSKKESFISTEGALRRPMTYDNHPSNPYIALKTSSHELRKTRMN